MVVSGKGVRFWWTVDQGVGGHLLKKQILVDHEWKAGVNG